MEENYPSKYINASTFEDGAETLTITKAYREEVGMEGQKEVKPHVAFAETDKLWTVNKTNFRALCQAFGHDSFDQWIGHTVQLSTGFGSHGFGKPDGPIVVMVIPKQGDPALVQEQSADQESEPEPDDPAPPTDVPF